MNEEILFESLDRIYVTSGRRGSIYRCEYNHHHYCFKKALSKEFVSNIQREILVLQKIKTLNLSRYTHLLTAWSDRFVCDWIEGLSFDVVWEKALFPKKQLLYQLLERAYILDTHHIEHGELHRPMSNVLVDRHGEVYLIDFDQGSFGNTHYKNLRHIMQWMLREKLISLEQVKLFASYPGKKLYENLLQCKEKIVE